MRAKSPSACEYLGGATRQKQTWWWSTVCLSFLRAIKIMPLRQIRKSALLCQPRWDLGGLCADDRYAEEIQQCDGHGNGRSPNNRSGSRGGGNNLPMIVVNMFGNVTQIETRDICPPLRAQVGGCIPMIFAYNQISQSAGYREDEQSVSLTVCGGSYGGQRGLDS